MNPLQYNTTAFPSRTFLPFSSGDDTSILAPPESVQVTKHALLDRCNYLSQDPYFSDYEARPLTFTTLTNARLVHGTLVVTEQNTCLRDTAYQAAHRTSHSELPLIEHPEGIEAAQECLQPSLHINGTALLFNTLRENYGHWHTQALINAAYIPVVSEMFGLPAENLLLINNCGFPTAQPFRFESVSHFNLQSRSFVVPPEVSSSSCISIERLIIPSTLAVPTNIAYHPFIWRYLRAQMLATLKPCNTQRSRKLFISRHDVQGRRGLINESELTERLKHLGYEIVNCSQLSYTDQLLLFSEAASVVSTHAGAMTNLLVSPAETKVLEIFHSQQLNPWYRNLCDGVGHRYQSYVTHLNESSCLKEVDVWFRTYEVNVNSVLEVATSM
jgi:capsular polysaccharide biosynthesis protein